MGRLDEMFTERAVERKAEVAPAPLTTSSDKLSLIEKMLRAQGVVTTNAKLNAWLLRHVGTAQILKGIADAS